MSQGTYLHCTLNVDHHVDEGQYYIYKLYCMCFLYVSLLLSLIAFKFRWHFNHGTAKLKC